MIEVRNVLNLSYKAILIYIIYIIIYIIYYIYNIYIYIILNYIYIYNIIYIYMTENEKIARLAMHLHNYENTKKIINFYIVMYF